MTWKYLNLTRFCFSVPYALCTENVTPNTYYLAVNDLLFISIYRNIDIPIVYE